MSFRRDERPDEFNNPQAFQFRYNGGGVKPHCSLTSSDDPNAEAAVKKLLSEFSGNRYKPRAIHETAWEYRKAGRYDKADQLYQYVVDNQSGNEDMMWVKTGIARLNIDLGNDAAVEKTIDILIADFNDHPELPTAIFMLGEEYYNKAMDDANQGRIDQAEANFVKTISVWDRIITQIPESNSPAMQDAYYFAGYCYGQLGEYAKAIQYWQKIVDAWPDYRYAGHAQFRMAHGYCMLGNSGVIPASEARYRMEQAYKTVVENYFDCPSANDALVRLGNLNYSGGRWTDAAKYYELFLEKFPEDKRWNDVLYSLAYTYQKMGQSQLAEELHRAFKEAAGSESGVSEGLKRWFENPEGPKK
jgi:tetratricopeptide (TPR) repeat protein